MVVVAVVIVIVIIIMSIIIGSKLGSSQSPAPPTNSEMGLVDDGESSGHTSYENDDYIQGILAESNATDIQRIQTGHAQTTGWEDLSTVPQEGSDASGSNESELEQPLDVLAGMASVPRGG